MVLTGKEIKELAQLIAGAMRDVYQKPVDNKWLKVPELSKEIGVSQDRLRDAIRAGHYGHIHPVGKGVFYATATDARDYHFGREGGNKYGWK